ncbi:hypothetical protein HS9_03198 [Bacillus velezensis]|nr:hypothetical protein HS9_03198 [Bacillus velezensis]
MGFFLFCHRNILKGFELYFNEFNMTHILIKKVGTIMSFMLFSGLFQLKNENIE